MVLQGWLESSEVAGSIGKGFFWFWFFLYTEDNIYLIWMLFRLNGYGFPKVNGPVIQQWFKSSVFIVKYLFNGKNPLATNSSFTLLR